MTSRDASRRGFVLLEAVVALAIIGLVALGFLQVRSQQIRVTGQARELLTAQALAEDRLSALRLLDYDGLRRPPDSLVAGEFPPPFEAFSWQATVELQEEEYDLFSVQVVVSGPRERFPLGTLVHGPRAVPGGASVEEARSGALGRAGGRDPGGRTGRGDQAGRGRGEGDRGAPDARGGGRRSGRGAGDSRGGGRGGAS